MANEALKIQAAIHEILDENPHMPIAEAIGLAKKTVQLHEQLDQEALVAELNANTQ